MTTDKKSDTPRTAKALAKTQGMFKAACSANGFLDHTLQLECELNEAKELIREVRDDEVNAQDECDKYLRDHIPSELSALRAKVIELEKDKARIDWLDANIYGSTGQPETEHTPHPVHTWIFEAPIFSDEDGGLRASIDAAMAQNDER